ncbi:hypothetical protein GN958_ATG11507 [Phytophthora infestans]|nr:hypothetical protein GN958_ATG11507 [Phytophthora infestans]
MVLLLLVSRETLATAFELQQSSDSTAARSVHSDIRDGTIPRTQQNENEPVPEGIGGEDRALPFKLSSWTKNKYWSMTGKTEDDVMGILGLKGLSIAAQKKHANYAYLQKYRYYMEGKILDNWVIRGDNMDTVWHRLGLTNVPVGTLKSTKAFETYLRFMKRFDRSVKRQYDEGTITYLWTVYRSQQEGQHLANIRTWKNAKRSDSSVKEALGLDTSNYNMNYFKQFQLLPKKEKK